MKLRSIFVAATAALAASVAHAVWNANTVGVVTAVLLYPNNEQILFRIDPMPTTGCTYNDYFELSPSTNNSVESRKNMYAMLLAARHTALPVTVGYDTASGCGPSGRPAIFAVFAH